jgi:hypothetical protein
VISVEGRKTKGCCEGQYLHISATMRIHIQTVRSYDATSYRLLKTEAETFSEDVFNLRILYS